MGGSQPFMYNAEWRNDTRFPTTKFDPKAVTRASWEQKPRKPLQICPLISFDRHPDAHMVLSHQSNLYLPLGHRTKIWIKALRKIQLLIRILQINGAIGSLVLLILITNVEEVAGWIMRISPAVAAAHCLYAVYHLSRKASGRTPGSSAAYHVFASISDSVVISLYAFGAYATHKNAQTWATRLKNQRIMEYFVPAVYHVMIGAGGLHFISLSISLWLGLMFHRIRLMPPDMNPLEDHLTARPFHRRNKSSITNGSSIDERKGLSTTVCLLDETSSKLHGSLRPAAVPFLSTRTRSSPPTSPISSYTDLSSRRYQFVSSHSPRSSVLSTSERHSSAPRSSQFGRYTSTPDLDAQPLRMKLPSNGTDKRRAGKMGTWIPIDSSISKNSQCNYNVKTAAPMSNHITQSSIAYAALGQAYNEDNLAALDLGNSTTYDRPDIMVLPDNHPNPLASHPTSHKNNDLEDTSLKRDRKNFSHTGFAWLSELSGNSRKVSNSRDITDHGPEVERSWKRQRDSSVQLDNGFYSKSYGQLNVSSPPISVGSDRKLSSGFDYGGGMSERRNVSGQRRA